MRRVATVTLAIALLLAAGAWRTAPNLAFASAQAAPARVVAGASRSAGDASWTWMRQAHERAARFGDDSPQPVAF